MKMEFNVQVLFLVIALFFVTSNKVNCATSKPGDSNLTTTKAVVTETFRQSGSNSHTTTTTTTTHVIYNESSSQSSNNFPLSTGNIRIGDFPSSDQDLSDSVLSTTDDSDFLTSTMYRSDYSHSDFSSTSATENNVTNSSPSSSEDVLSNLTNLNKSQDATTDSGRGGTFRFDPSVLHDGLVSEATYNRIKAVTTVILYVLPVLGIAFNCFNIVVFSSEAASSSFSRLLLCLSSAELVVVTLSCTGRLVEASLSGNKLNSKPFLTMVIYLSIYSITVVNRTTFCYIFFISAERVVAVVFPLKAKHFRLIRKPVTICFALLLLNSAFHLEALFKYDVIGYSDKNGNTLYRFSLSSHFTNNELLFRILFTCGDVLFVYVPLFGSLVLNVVLTVALRFHAQFRKKLGSSQDSRKKLSKVDTQITVTVLLSSVVFIVLVLPIQLTEISQMVFRNYGMNLREHYIFVSVVQVGGVFNQAAYCTSFVCYYARGGRFRKRLHEVICRCRSAQPQARQENRQTEEQVFSSTENQPAVTIPDPV